MKNNGTGPQGLLGALSRGVKKFAAALGRFIKKHKLVSFVLLAALVAGGYFGWKAVTTPAVGTAVSYSFIRTTTLEKGSLDDTVSATGTVGSADTSTVTYASAGAGSSTPKIKTVNVAVGDAVAAGDVIVTLDTSDIEDSIAKAKESLADQISDAKEKYSDAVSAYNDAVDAATAYESTVAAALAAQSAAEAKYTSAAASVQSFQTTYNLAAAAEESAGVDYNAKVTAYNEASGRYYVAVDTYNNALLAAQADPANADLAAALASAQAAMEAAAAEQAAAQQTAEQAQNAYAAAGELTRTALSSLNSAKTACNYDTYEKEYTAAKQTYTQARTQMDQYEKTVTSCEDAVKTTKKNLDNASTSDTLETLEEQLENCSLTAETSGKVTALNASVGSAPSGTIATIQDTDSLKIAITIGEADINDVAVGMTCRITSDATEGTITGTLTQIDPVAGQSGSFGAEVTVTTANSGLLVGMNATVDIVKSSTADCFMVPIDAVGSDESGDYVYRSTGGSGTDMTFEKVAVTTGESNDYYVEIVSAELSAGDVIRSSADLTQGVEETTDTAGLDFGALMGSTNRGGMSGNMGGGNATRGERPSENMGGGAPAGGM